VLRATASSNVQKQRANEHSHSQSQNCNIQLTTDYSSHHSSTKRFICDYLNYWCDFPMDAIIFRHTAWPNDWCRRHRKPPLRAEKNNTTAD
jgi:hypothetical protein